MEEFKVENFLAENPGVAFPIFRTLSRDEELAVQERWLREMLKTDVNSSEGVVEAYASLCSVVKGVNAEDTEFGLNCLLNNFGISPAQYVYVNWASFGKIDELKFQDLSDCFWDIWYPSSDDIEIFDQSFSWIVSVAHYGAVGIWKNN